VFNVRNPRLGAGLGHGKSLEYVNVVGRSSLVVGLSPLAFGRVVWITRKDLANDP